MRPVEALGPCAPLAVKILELGVRNPKPCTLDP